jgi:hypothetical protein
VVISNSSQPLRLLLNVVGQDMAWLGLRLVGPSGRDMLGAEVEVRLVDGTSIFRRSRTDGSYCSANDPRILIGLEGRTEVESLRVTWPDGDRETWPAPEKRRYTTLRKGEGTSRESR